MYGKTSESSSNTAAPRTSANGTEGGGENKEGGLGGGFGRFCSGNSEMERHDGRRHSPVFLMSRVCIEWNDSMGDGEGKGAGEEHFRKFLRTVVKFLHWEVVRFCEGKLLNRWGTFDRVGSTASVNRSREGKRGRIRMGEGVEERRKRKGGGGGGGGGGGDGSGGRKKQ
uniref:Uncharacterized protein n=1 Tax=Vespula pensylvanica TaxID=30213 RepID=A0A834KHH4_VESPE|nr:hypothetical protein H0235_014406 [Vespula pensylvanica]